MALTYIKSNKGADLLVIDSYIFRKEKTVGERQVWRCADHKTDKCSSRCQTKDGEFVKTPNEHSHPPDLAKVQARRLVSAMKQRAATTTESTHDILAAVTKSMGCSGSVKKTQVENLKKTIRRVRREHIRRNGDTQELIIPDEYSQMDADLSENDATSSPVIEISDASITACTHSTVPKNSWFQTVTRPNKSVHIKRRLPDDCDDMRSLMARLPESRQEDQFDIAGKNVAAKLRTLDREQRILAEKLINDVLFEAELGNLTRSRQVVTNVEPTPSLSNQIHDNISCV